MKNKNNKIYIVFGACLIILGVSGVFWPTIYELFVDDSGPSSAEAKLPSFAEQFIGSEDPNASPIPVDPSTFQNRLVIADADVDINMPVFPGDTEKILNKGGWLYPFTSKPELGGNSVIFGHRYMYRPPKSNTFWNLDKVEIGDEMIFFWQGREYKYKVFEIKIIEPTDLSVIQPSKDPILTVITCTPLFSTKQRLVVVGALTTISPR